MTETNIIKQHEAMDMILKYLIADTSGKPIHSYNIWQDVFPDQPEQTTYVLLKAIMGTVDEIVTSHIRHEDLHNFEVFFESNILTETFLNKQGGFTRLNEIEEAEKAEQTRLSILNLEKLEAEVDIIRFKNGLGKKFIIWTFVVTVLSFLTSSLTTVISNQSYPNFAPSIDSLRHHVSALTDSLKSTNSRLQSAVKLQTQDTIKKH